MLLRRLAIGIAAAALFATACGPDDGDSTGSGASSTSTAAEATTSEPDVPTTTTDASSPSTTEAGETVDTIPDSELPGEPFDLFPYEDATLSVVGVEAGDFLFVRAGPGTSYPEVVALDPMTTDIRAHGVNRMLDEGGAWALVDIHTFTGWASLRHLLQPGPVEDLTHEIGDVPPASSIDELAANVADVRTADTPEAETTIVARPESGDLHEIVVDILGFRDDAVGGERLHIFATAEDGSFRVKSIEVTVLCSRGVEDGLCL